MTRPAQGRTGRLSAEERQILAERARSLAQPLEEARATTATLELVTFSRAGSAYAVAALEAAAVVRLGELTPVPGTPPAVRGVVNHRGRILAAIDVGSLIAGAERDSSEAAFGIVVTAGPASFVLLADAVPELVGLEEDDVAPRTGTGETTDRVVRGVTGTMVSVLDVPAVVDDPRVVVLDEVE